MTKIRFVRRLESCPGWTRTAALVLAAGLGALACGGPPAVEPTHGALTPPSLPPSMAGPKDPPRPPAGPSPDVTRGLTLLESNDLAGARRAFEAALSRNASDPDAHVYLGSLDERGGDRASAEKHYRAALVATPDHEGGAVNLSALLLDAGKLDESISLARGALATRPGSASLHTNLGVALAAKGDEAEATRHLEEAVRLAPKDPMPLLTLGQWLGKWKKNDAAKARFQQADKLSGDDVGVLASIGFELKNIGAFPECIAVLDRTLAKRDAAEIRTYRALCKLGAQDKAGALADLETAVRKEPKYGPAHFYLGGRYAEAGRWKDVVSEYEIYLKLDSDGPLRKAAEDRIKIAREKLAKKK